MSIKEIQELIKLIAKTELSEFKYAKGDVKLHVRGKSYVTNNVGTQNTGGPSIINVPAAAPAYPAAPAPAAAAPVAAAAAPTPAPAAAPAADDESKYVEVRSPMIGTFYRSPSPDKRPLR